MIRIVLQNYEKHIVLVNDLSLVFDEAGRLDFAIFFQKIRSI